MLELQSKKLLGNIILVAVAIVTLVVAPYTLLDPINLPKLLVLVFFSIVALSLFVTTVKSVFNSESKNLLIVLSLFVLQIILVLLFSGANFGGQLYGTFGRNTGALAYLSLAFLLLGASLVSDQEFLKKFVRMGFIVGVSLIVYGNIQFLGLEPLPFVNAYTVNAPIGTFGNSNFQSAFMGLTAVVAFTMALNTEFKIRFRVGLALMGFASIIVIYETLAKQGYLSFMAGAGVVVVLWLFMSKRKALGIAVAGIGLIGGGLVFLALVNIGPLANYLYKSSLAARGFYWQAGMKMVVDHPFFGVGMDGFGDWYRRTRSEEYLAKGFQSVSDTAHNVYLDIASSGGFPLILIYCAIIVLVIISIVRVSKRGDGIDYYFLAIVGAWVAYQAQSFVSINQLGLAIWGWVLSGLIIGYEINTRVKVVDQTSPKAGKQQRKQSKVLTQPMSSATVMRVFGGVILGAIVAIPPYYVNASFLSALKSGDIKAIQSAAYLRPIDERRLLHLATILRDNKLDAEAIVVVRDATVGYPDSFDLWNLWASIPSATPADVDYSKAQMKRLDPFNPDLK